ncbi:hypothetical protein ACFWBS_38900 [Streptomyces mirabilis]|uniref:hypothetical protein n=1 Tax=Streptomyces mirabilis TaxID=68239 RepID=UPI0036654718
MNTLEPTFTRHTRSARSDAKPWPSTAPPGSTAAADGSTAANGRAPALDTDSLWVVGFRFNAAGSHSVRHFYLVQQASGPACAREIALQLASSAGEREARGDAALDENWTELRRVGRNEVGDWQLSPAGECREGAKTGGQSATATAEGPDGRQA